MSDAAVTVGGAADVVGRTAERAQLDVFVAAVARTCRAMLIRGEPGIGKTALWRYGVEACRAAGFTILRTRPAEEEMPLGLVGLDDLFEQHPLVREETQDASATGRAVLTALRRLSERAPVVVAVDDAQWLDAGSARALRYALRRLDLEPVGVLAAIRLGSPDPLTETSLDPGRVAVLELGPMGLGDLRRVLSGSVTSISRPHLRRLHEVSGGNPLYAIELARAVASDDQAGSGEIGVALPGSLQAAIARRLATVPDELAPLLQTVSALGRPTESELRALLVDSPLDALLATAEEHGILVVEESLEVRFAHPLLGSAVYSGLSPLARRALHAGLAARAVDADVRARHLALSTDQPDAEISALLETAAERARRSGAPDLAAEFAGHSVRLTPPVDESAATRRALAQVVFVAAAGEAGRALALANALAAEQPPGPDHAETVVQRLFVESHDLGQQVSLLRRALEEAGADELLRARVLDRLGWMCGLYGGDLRGGIAYAREAAVIAESSSDAELRMWTSSHLALLEELAGTPRRDLMAEAVAVAGAIRDPPLGGGPRVQLARLRFWAGELDAARADFEELRELFARTGKDFERPYRFYDLALVECAAGNLAAARELVQHGLEAARDADDSRADGWLHYPLGLVEAWSGRPDAARAAAEVLRAWAVRRGERVWDIRVRSILGLLALSEGDPAAASRELTEAARQLDEIGFANPGASPVLADAVEALAWAGETDTAASLLERLERENQTVGSAWATAATARCVGILMLVRGATDEAADRLEGARTEFDRLGYLPDAARAALAHGRALIRGGHRTLAADALADTRERFAHIGAVLWEARAAEELERAAPGRASGTLTPTERRIAALVARGLRNREIAQTLFVSVATVEAHLTRTYRKLGIRSRSELARLVADGSVFLGADE